MTTTVKPLDSYTAKMDVSWNFDYKIEIPKIQDLYSRAKNNQWDADDLSWDTPIDPSNPFMSPEHSQYSKMPFFKKLSISQQETFTAHSTAQLLSQFLHGEQGALMTAATITHAVPDIEAKFYSATQTMDEARHVEVYKRYVDKIAIHYPMVPWLKELIDLSLHSEDYQKIMIGMNMIVEGLALGSFNNMYRQTSEPLLKAITFNVMRDESRHVSFGHAFLKPLIAKMDEAQVEDLAQFAFDSLAIMIKGQAGPIDEGFIQVLEASNIDPQDFTKGIQEAAELGITRSLPPGQIHSLDDLLIPALHRAGLITPRTEKLFAEAGVQINPDPRVLNSLEDQK